MPIAEESVGIRAYTTTTEGFTAILRHRFTDFKVNEIDLDGNVVHLTSFDLPPPAADSHLANAPSGGAAGTPLDSPAAVAAAYEALLGEGNAAKAADLKTFLESAQAYKEDPKSAPAPAPLDLDPLPDKDLRRAVHGIFKGLSWAPQLTTVAVTLADEQQSVQVTVGGTGDARGGGKGGQKRKWGDSGGGNANEQWGGGSRKYLRFALYKENYDTHAAFTAIAKALRLPQKVFAVAGTKDKRGVTVQWATAFRVPPGKLVRANNLRSLRVGNFSYYPEQMRLGDLQGNRFEVVLRALSAPDSATVEAAAAALRTAGFINYYGLQRFGSGDVPTHHVGRALLRGEWEEAVRAILTPPPNARPEVASALRSFLDKNGSPDKALATIPRGLVGERAILSVLAKEGRTAYVNALCSIPRNLRTMYIHAYQSYLWNEAASERISKHGAGAVIEGDLVIPRATMAAARRAKAASTADEDTAAAASAEDAVNEEEIAENVEPHVVTAEEAAAGTFSIEDLVLPLPGSKIIYPANDIADVYKTVAERDGVSLDAPTHKVKEFSQIGMPGTYRHVLYRPQDLEYETLRYDNPEAELARTDLDAMGARGGGGAAETGTEGRHLALRLAFSLPSSTYATMLVRELTKMPTTVDFAKSLKHP